MGEQAFCSVSKQEEALMTSSYHPNNPKMLCVWFNPYSVEHLQAYRELQKGGFWPKWFIEKIDAEGIIIHQHWLPLIEGRIAACWVKHSLGE
jgi:hypothetical protein